MKRFVYFLIPGFQIKVKHKQWPRTGRIRTKILSWGRGGSVVELWTPEPEVQGLNTMIAVSTDKYPGSGGSVKIYWKIVDLDVKQKNKQNPVLALWEKLLHLIKVHQIYSFWRVMRKPAFPRNKANIYVLWRALSNAAILWGWLICLFQSSLMPS